MKNSHLIIAALLAGSIVLAGCSRDEPVDSTAAPAATGALETPPAMSPEPEAAAVVQVTDLQLGTEVGDDRNVTSPQTAFAANDETIFASVTTTSDSSSPATGTLG